MEERPSPREHSIAFTRHSKSGYETYERIRRSDNPREPVDYGNQVTPDLTPEGVLLAEQKSRELFDRFDPAADMLVFVSSNEARAVETANIYRREARQRGFEVLRSRTPENEAKRNVLKDDPAHPRYGVKEKLGDEIGEGEIRTLDALSLNVKDPLIQAIFESDATIERANIAALPPDERVKWDRARSIIATDDHGGWGPNFYHHGEAVQAIFPQIKTTRDLYEGQFQKLVRLAQFGLRKAREHGGKKSVKILAFGHENYMGYALGQYFGEHEIKNCETVTVETDTTGKLIMERRGKTAEI